MRSWAPATTALSPGSGHVAAERPDRIAVLERFDRDESRRIYAGADLFLMPSRFEPSGQGQLIAMRYGTVPVVRATGGLVGLGRRRGHRPDAGTGFVFGPAEAGALVGAVQRAVAAWGDGARWAAIVRRGMSADLSWDVPAARYAEAYRLIRG